MTVSLILLKSMNAEVSDIFCSWKVQRNKKSKTQTDPISSSQFQEVFFRGHGPPDSRGRGVERWEWGRNEPTNFQIPTRASLFLPVSHQPPSCSQVLSSKVRKAEKVRCLRWKKQPILMLKILELSQFQSESASWVGKYNLQVFSLGYQNEWEPRSFQNMGKKMKLVSDVT